MIRSAGVITTALPLCQGDQCLVLAHSGYIPHPFRHMNCTKNLSTEPSAVIYPRHSEKSEPLKPKTVIAQRPGCTTRSIVQSRNSHSHSTQGSHSHRMQRILSSPWASNIYGESRVVPRASCLLVPCLGICDKVRLGEHLTVLSGCPAFCRLCRPDSNQWQIYASDKIC